jgi:hypothetical protein
VLLVMMATYHTAVLAEPIYYVHMHGYGIWQQKFDTAAAACEHYRVMVLAANDSVGNKPGTAVITKPPPEDIYPDLRTTQSCVVFWSYPYYSQYYSIGILAGGCLPGRRPKETVPPESFFAEPGDCEEPPLAISLSGGSTTPPAGTRNSNPIPIVAKVTRGGAPEPGQPVTFTITAIAGTGGHEQHPDKHIIETKPKGSIPNGVTDAAGELRVRYAPSRFAGVYLIEATCGGCSNVAQKHVLVLVDGLEPLSADSVSPRRYELVGSIAPHHGNHYFTADALKALHDLVAVMQSEGWGVVGVNDASLIWGGGFDLNAAWSNSHAEHRQGEEVDLSFRRPTPVPPQTISDVYEYVKSKEGIGMPPSWAILWHRWDNPPAHTYAHFHVYLLGQKTSRISKF